MRNSPSKRCKRINPLSSSSCSVAACSPGTFLRLLRLVQPGGIIEKRMRVKQAPLLRRQLAMCTLVTVSSCVIQSLYVGFAVNAVSVGSAENSSGLDSKTLTPMLGPWRLFGGARTVWKRYDSLECGSYDFRATNPMGLISDLLHLADRAGAVNCTYFGRAGLSRVPVR